MRAEGGAEMGEGMSGAAEVRVGGEEARRGERRMGGDGMEWDGSLNKGITNR